MLVDTFEKFHSMLDGLTSSAYIAVDVETTGLDYLSDEVIGIGFATEDAEWYVDFPTLLSNTDEQNSWSVTDVWKQLRLLFDLNKYILISHNTPFDMYFINRELVKYLCPSPLTPCLNWWDTLSMAAFTDENLIGVRVELESESGETKSVGALSLKALSYMFLGRKQRLYEEDFTSWMPEERAEYGCSDVRNTYDLAVLFSNYLQCEGLLEYYQKYVAPMSFVTHALEANGIKVDVPKLLEVQQAITAEIKEYYDAIVALMPPQEAVVIDLSKFTGTKEELQQQLNLLVAVSKGFEEYMTAKGKVSTAKGKLLKLYEETKDDPFWQQVLTYEYTDSNPNSYQQLGQYLAKKNYHLPITPSGNLSVSSDTLEALAQSYPNDPLWGPLFKMRKLEKLEGTYVSALLELAWEDGTVHPEWNSSGTATGRYSTSVSGQNKKLRHKRGPALQTIPRPDTIVEAGWEYNPREWFISSPGHCLCVADLSQAEVRMLAVRSGDPDLRAAIASGEDIHSSVAARVHGHVWEQADDKLRKTLRGRTKQVVFGTIYGIGPKGLALRLNISEEEAADLIHDFYATFPGILEWKREETEHLLRYGYVESMLGRRRCPVLLQDPPRVVAKPKTEEYIRQKLNEKLWQTEYDYALEKSGFGEDTDDQAIIGRATRQAINFEIQGSVAEIMNYGLWRLVKDGYTVRGQVHDEVIIEVLDEEEVKEQLKKFLIELFEIEINGVQFRLDVHFGSSWACGK